MTTAVARISIGLGIAFSLAFAALAAGTDAPTAVVHKGWFSDEKCAPSKVKAGNFGPNGRECVEKCLKEGARMVFIDETAKEMYFVDNPSAAEGQASHYVEVAASVDAGKKSLHVASVKVLKTYVASCAVPKKDQPIDSQ
ncbi:MAG: hypothetical protein ABI592_03950 [Acidobacteriota bacterium]